MMNIDSSSLLGLRGDAPFRLPFPYYEIMKNRKFYSLQIHEVGSIVIANNNTKNEVWK